MSNTSLNIAYVITKSDPIGGAQIFVRDMAESHKNLGDRVTVILGEEGTLTESLRDKNIPYRIAPSLVREINPIKDLRAYKEILDIVRDLKVDIVSTHSSKAGWIGRLAAHRLNIPCTFHAHGWAFTEGVPLVSRIVYIIAETFAGLFSSKIICVSEYDRNLALRYNIAAPKKIITIHNAVPDVSRELISQPSNPIVNLIMVARFQVPKDHLLLFEALSGIIDIAWNLTLIGDGPLLNEAIEFAQSKMLCDRIKFLGTRSDVAKQLAKSQIFILTTNWEGLPLSIIEAMRAGLPVIASDVGGIHELVVDGETGYLISKGDHISLGKHLACLISNPDLRRKLGNNGRKRYEVQFSYDTMFNRTRNTFLDIAGHSGGASE